MKTIKHLFTALLLLCATVATAHDFVVDGIYYDKTGWNYSVEVVSGDNEYTGAVVIPETITYEDVTYWVTSIGYEAFDGCTGLTSVEIPNSVTSIGICAFYNCSGLTSIEIPNSVTSIGDGAFRNCI